MPPENEKSRPAGGGSENSLTRSVTPAPAGVTAFRDLLDLLEFGPGEFVQVATQPPGGTFGATVHITDQLPPILQDRDVWFGVNPCTQVAAGRPGAADVTRVSALWADLDVKPRGCPSFDVAQRIIDDLSGALGTRPVAVIWSGHGLQPLWVVNGGEIADGTDRSAMRALLRRWGRLVAYFAQLRGAQVDSVYDLPRILRAPGSVNVKDAAAPVAVVALADAGAPVDVERILEALDEYSVLDRPEDYHDHGLIVSAPAEWPVVTKTCNYVAGMIKSWATATPPGRHPWLIGQATRLAAARRLGCLATAGIPEAENALADRFRALVSGDRGEARGEIFDALAWGVQKVAGMTVDRARADLGSDANPHTHLQPAPVIRQVAVGITAPEGAEQAAVKTSLAAQHSGQVRMAYRLAEAFTGRLMFVHGIGWHRWSGSHWTADDRGEAKRAVLDVLRVALGESLGDEALRKDVHRCESAAGIAGVLDVASALTQFAFTVDDLDPDPYLLNVANGTLDLHTLELHPHQPADRITKVARAAYRTDAAGPAWAAFLGRVLPDVDVRSFLARYVGVGLTGRVTEHVLAILTGEGRNGKSVFYGAVCHALGDYASTAEPDLFMHRENAHPTGEMDLLGVRWVVVSESDEGRRLAPATVKRLTGGDRIRARRMRQDFVEFEPSHTAALVTNYLPKVTGDDAALWARLRVVPFDVVIPREERDVHLAEKLTAEADAVLTWAVNGWTDYCSRGLDEPPAVLAATDHYQAGSDAFRRFLDECCIVNQHMRVPVGDLYTRYLKWCAEDGSESLAKNPFGDALDRKGFPAVRGQGGVRFRCGLTLAGDENDSD